MSTVTKLFFFYVLLFNCVSETLGQISDNGILISTALTTIDFGDPNPRVRSIATANLPPLSSGVVAVEFRLKGGDGGTGTWDGLFTDLTANGGQGGVVIFTIPVTAANAGQQITFYQGKRGESFTHPISASGGGGGSTAIIAQNGTLFAVAAGGGGGSATEIIQSNGLPGGETASDGVMSACSDQGLAGIPVEPNGTISQMYFGSLFGETLFLAYGAGGGGGLFGSQQIDAIHAFEISGKSPELNGGGGIRPAQDFLADLGGCDPLNPFSVGCDGFSTQDLSAGGAGYSGGGCGGQHISRNFGDVFDTCNNIQEPRYGAGGGGGGYLGGGGGDKGRGGGGGSSYVVSTIENPTFITGTTTSNPQNGFVVYRAFYDTTPPVAVCQNASVTLGVGSYLNDDGGFSIGAGVKGQALLNPVALDGGSTDNSIIEGISASQTTFNCSDLGVQNVTFTVTDGNNNTSSCTAQVTVIDNFPPTITAFTSSIINASGFGIIDMGTNTQVTVTPPNNLSFEDNCSVANVTQASPFTVTCADIGSTIFRPVVATDVSGNVKTLLLEYIITSSALPTGVFYVNGNQANDNGDGLSWATAKKYLSSALSLVDGICNNQRQIWVAAGTYYPDEGVGQSNDDRQSYFQLEEISMYGGFVGDETSLNQRDPKNNVTILSGDLQQNDNGLGTFTDNAYHVLVGFQTNDLAVVDGFTIQGGYANGIFVDASGGGLINYEGNVTLQNCILQGNYGNYGGAISNYGPSSLNISNCVLSGNSSDYGGGIYNLFNTTTTLTNCTFSGNSADIEGGAIWNDLFSETVVRNSIIYNNRENGTTGSTGASVRDQGLATTYNNSLVANTTAPGVISNEDPLFAQPIDFANANLPTTAGDFRPGNGRIVDTGNNSFNTLSKDLDGNVRIQSETIDLGPYESPKFNISLISPGNNSNQIPVFSDITFYFDQNIPNYLANRTKILIYGSMSGHIKGSYTGGGDSNIIDFEPEHHLQPGEIVTIEVSNKLVNNPIAHSFVVTVPSQGVPANSSTPKIELPSVDGPQRTFPLDLDGDGDLDIVAIAENAQFQFQIVWYENDGNSDPNFTLHQIVSPSAGSITGVDFGDLNNDGHLDVIYKKGTTIFLAKSNGNVQPTFEISPILSVQTGGFAEDGVLVNDLDNDGLLDIVTQKSGQELVWYKNSGTPQPTFTEHFVGDISAYPGIVNVLASDVDSDGDLDIIINTFKLQNLTFIGFILLLENNGSSIPSFTKREIYSNLGVFSKANVKDINSDNHPDIIFNSENILWLKNDGASPTNFTIQALQPQPTDAASIDVGDMDGDTHPDLIAAVFTTNSINWYKNDGMDNPSFTSSLVNNSTPLSEAISLGDLDGDGDLDVVMASELGNSVAWLKTSQSISQFGTSPSNHATNIPLDANIILTFEEAINNNLVNDNNIFVNGSQTGVISGSFNGGGTSTITFNPATNFKPGEIITVAITAGLGLLQSYVFSFTSTVSAESPGAFDNGESIISTQANGARSVFSADLDGDGDLDVLSASNNDNKIAWYTNDGAGNFGGQQVISTLASNARCVFSTDLDGDGDLDVLSASQNDDKIAWYPNDGSGNFGPQQIISVLADGAQSVYAADLDGDGDLDVLSASQNDDKIAWYQNNGFGNFGSQQIISTLADGAYHVYAADLDDDGDLDVLSASNLGDKISWYENNGLGSFGAEIIISTLTDGARWVHAADLDNDGDLDVLSASQNDDKLAWYENDGSGVFGSQQVISATASGAVNVYTADLDGDNDLDVLSAAFMNSQIAQFKNDGSGNFGPIEVISSSAFGALNVCASDIDGDGDLDVLSASTFNDKIAWYENVSNVSPPLAICQNITVELDSSGQAFITAAQVDGGSTSVVGIASLTVSPDSFDCSHIGSNEVVLTVTDLDGNATTCTSLVTIEDNTSPTAICQNINVQLGFDDVATIVASDVDGGSFDACGIASLSLDVDTFTSSNIGSNTVVLTVTDANGNSAQCSAIVTVLDCPGDFNNDGIISTGDLTFLLAQFGCSSNCQADINGDGLTNSGDLSFLLSVYGTSCN